MNVQDRNKLVSILNETEFVTYRNIKEIGDICDIDPSYVSRILRGDFKLINSSVMRICEKAGINPYNPSFPRNRVGKGKEHNLIESAVKDCWDGTETHAKLIAKAIYLVSESRKNLYS